MYAFAFNRRIVRGQACNIKGEIVNMREIKRNQAIAIIIVIAVAGALGTWGIIYLVTPQPTAYTVPGVSGTVTDSQVLKIGVLDDMEYKTGMNVWRGAILAAKEINQAGGVTVGGSKYYIGLISEDTQEADPMPDPSKGITAATKMVSINKPHAIVGGFRTEVLSVYLSTVMAAKIPFVCTGSATPDFTEDVKADYATNKYFFRVTPMNSTDLGVESGKYLLTRLLAELAMKGHSVSKVAIIHENLDWVNASVASLNATLVSKGLQTKTYPFTLGSPESTFNAFWTDINNTFGAQLVVPIISGPDGVKLGKTYGTYQPHCFLAGINVAAQSADYWGLTTNNCQYECTVQVAHRTNKTVKTVPFWDAFVADYGTEPIYTAFGAYDAVYMLANSMIAQNSFTADKIVTGMETYNSANLYTGASGYLGFKPTSHEVLAGLVPVTGPVYLTIVFCQWQAGGTKVVLNATALVAPYTGLDLVYPSALTTGTLQIPSWWT